MNSRTALSRQPTEGVAFSLLMLTVAFLASLERAGTSFFIVGASGTGVLAQGA